jgi:hypothetical protein
MFEEEGVRFRRSSSFFLSLHMLTYNVFMIEPGISGTTVRMVSGSLIFMAFGILCKESAYPLQLASGKLFQQLQLDLKEG